ncbi:MAG: AMP-binding protein, partial [Chthoniobacterales bacterium]|nr:AMP-binding protein [Chthoniobacterales bacterium]
MKNALLNAWLKTLASQSDAPAVLQAAGDALRTFREIDAEAADFGAGMLSGFSSGSVVAVQLGNHTCWPAVLLACWQRGLVVLPLERAISASERESALQVCRAAALLTDNGDGVAAARLEHETVNWGQHVPVLLKLTSGTTAAPRVIRFRSEQLLADCVQICDTMGIT